MDVGEKIKAARKSKGFTQEELGKRIGVQKSAIAKYESGRVVNIKRSTLQKLADALDLRGSDLIVESNPKETASVVARVLNDVDLMDMIEEYYKLNEDDKKTVRNLISSLAK